MKILLVGGYGSFGGRLAQLLASRPGLTLFIAGRSLTKASAFCASLRAGAELRPLAFDRDADIEAQLQAVGPDLLVDASGPFQAYGDDPYRVVKACLQRGVDYLDLADDAGFVDGIGRFDGLARERGRYALSGVSTFPVLTAAAVRHLARDLAQVTEIRGGIAPSPYARVGLNVLRAISGYAGKPIALIRDGQASSGQALTETFNFTIAPPGCVPLRKRRFSLMAVADLQVLPRSWPGLQSIWMGAAPVPAVLHRALRGLAWLVRLRLLPTLLPLAPLFHSTASVLRWGEHRGGMFVQVRGKRRGNGESVERSWHLLAEGDDGPYIPCMAIDAIVRRSLSGEPPAAGARACVHDLELQDYAPAFGQRRIRTGEREQTAAAAHSLYRKVLGEAWDSLPAPIQAMHERSGDWQAQGRARVERGRGVLSALAAAVFGFPKAAGDVPVSVCFQSRTGHEHWRRDFAGKRFSSVQTPGSTPGLLCERFGPFAFDLALLVDAGKLRFIVRDWRFLGLPLPAAWAPAGNSHEFAEDGRFHFHIEITHPLTGLIVRYRGWLQPQ